MQFSLFFFSSGHDTADQYRLLLRAARFADEAGLSAVWTPERHFHEFGAPFPNPAVTGAALAATTSRIDVRAGSVVLPLHEPIRVAEEWAMVDQLSSGRAGVAIASGWNPQDFVLAPDRFAASREAMRRGLEELTALWAGRQVERVGPDGGSRHIGTYPRPCQERLPVWITAAGSKETFELAGELGHGVLTHLLGQTWEELERNLVVYGDALRTAGHGVEQERVSVMMHTFLDERRDRALDVARGPLTSYMRSSMRLFGLKEPDRTEDGVPEETMRELLDHIYDEYADQRCLIGSVEDCLPRVESLAALGVDEVACLIDFGIGTDDVLRSLESLAALARECADL